MVRATMTELPTGTVTFLFTDVEGSTKLLHELGEEAYAEALAGHRRIVREACSARGGVEVDTQGDAFFVAFPMALGALEAARAITESLELRPLRLRMGLHTGTPLLTEEGYVGEDVHLAARVASAGHGGQVLASATTAALTDPRNSLLPGVVLRELGEHRLKDIAEPVAIFQLGEERFPPLKTISNTNLPRPASSFVGREAELSEVLAHVAGGARLLTLTGPGGSGKTRLALEAAASLVPAYKAGVFWVGLASLRDPALVTETISQTLGAKDGLAEHIQERELLLLLDNLEQVLEAAPELSALVTACPNLTVLVTSRELLRVQGEVEYPVPPLLEPEAVSLFCERAQLDASEEIAELCTRLDSLPLAVELAAARTKALTPAQILERLSQRLDLLKGGRDADPRQRTLRATIEWSYDLLTDDEQRLFRRLAVFSGGCTLEAAEQVADADVDTLQSLVEKSLLRFSGERFWTLETIREYAAERLDHSGEADEIRRRHAEHFLELAERAEPSLDSSDQAATVRFLDAERDNFRQALITLREPAYRTAMLRLAVALTYFWYIRSYVSEGRAWLEEALESATGPPGLRAKALRGLSNFLDGAGEYLKAEEAGKASVRLYRELALEREGLFGALNQLANVLMNLGKYEGAEILHEEALMLARELDDPRRIGQSLNNLAVLSLMRGEDDQAAHLAKESLLHLCDVADPFLRCIVLHTCGVTASRIGRSADAARLLRESITLSQDVGSAEVSAACLVAIAALTASEDPPRAARILGGAEAFLETGGHVLDPVNRELFDATVRKLEQRVGTASFANAMVEGRGLDPDDAIQYALRSLD